MSKKIFVPERGQFFWYVKEVFEGGLGELKIMHSKFDPRIHSNLVKRGNCFLSEEDALSYLIE